MIKGVAFAGVTGAGKSTLFRLIAAALAKEEGKSVTLLRNGLLQSAGFTQLAASRDPWKIAQYLQQALDAMRALSTLECMAGTEGRLVFLCESFALNLFSELQLWAPDVFDCIDAERADVGLAMIHLRLEENEILERSVRSTRDHRGEGWSRYLDAVGSNPAQQADYFERKRQMIARYFALCRPPKLEIRTSDMQWDTYATQILQLMRCGA